MRRRLFEAAAAAKIATSAAQRRNVVGAGALGHAPPAVDDHWVAGAAPDPGAQARALARASGGQLARVGGALLQLQRDYGNRHVQQVVQHLHQAPGPAPITRPSLVPGPVEDRYEYAAERVARQVAGGAPPRRATGDTATGRVPPIPAMHGEHGLAGAGVDDRVRQAIQGARGVGQPLPEQMRAPMERVLGADFQGVRLHTDPQADQLNRMLGARAFTTRQEIFFRRGEYRPGAVAGKRLLAHELTHVAQQTPPAPGAAAPAYRAQGPAVSPPTGAGVIQREKFDDDLDTEKPNDLTTLMSRVQAMTAVDVVKTWRRKLSRIPVFSRTISEQKLLNTLLDREDALTQASAPQPTPLSSRTPVATPSSLAAPSVTTPLQSPQQPASPPPITTTTTTTTSTTTTTPSSYPASRSGSGFSTGRLASPTSRSPEAGRTAGKTPTLSSSVLAPVPVSHAGPGLATPPEQGREQAAAPGPGVSPAPARGQETTPTAKQRPATSAREAARRQREEDEAREQGKREKLMGIQAKGEDLKERTTYLLRDDPIGTAEGWLADYTMLEFEQLAGEWAQTLTAESDLANDRKIKRLAGDLTLAISAVGKKKAQQEATQQKLGAAAAGATRVVKNLKDRKEEVENLEEIFDKYFELNIETVPSYTELLLKSLFHTAMNRVRERRDPLTTALLGYWETIRERAKQQQGRGPYVTLGRQEGREYLEGRAETAKVILWLGLPRMDEQGTANYIANDADEYQLKRERLVNEFAKGFIHETAHMWQLRRYENVSHPWTRKHNLGRESRPPKLPEDEEPMFSAPADVQSAFQELARGGEDGVAKDDPEVKRAYEAMKHSEYYRPGTNEAITSTRDRRARELVSHLIEIVYVWNDPAKFQKIFPKCSALLDRVIIKGADVGLQ